jgi:hypothetical protein
LQIWFSGLDSSVAMAAEVSYMGLAAARIASSDAGTPVKI